MKVTTRSSVFPSLRSGLNVDMDTHAIMNAFARMGAGVRIGPFRPLTRWDDIFRRIILDVRTDRRGEYFDVQLNPLATQLRVLDVRPATGTSCSFTDDGADTPESQRLGKDKFLCGHDERHWFVAAIPETGSVSNVATAIDALKPQSVRQAEEQAHLKGRDRRRRKNRAFVRQGEWFFLPEPGLRVDDARVLRNEPLRRGRGKPHVAEFCLRTGGELVYVNHRFPNGLTAEEYADWRRRDPDAKLRFMQMMRNPHVYVRGRISHADHATIMLEVWHRVEMNTETQSRAMRHIAFLD